jgi:hypothetical protein
MKGISSFIIMTNFLVVFSFPNKMLVLSPLIRTPKESEMALSNQVKESVAQAAGMLRESLAFAARTEHPVVISSLTDILVRLESLEHMDELMDKFGKSNGLPTTLG